LFNLAKEAIIFLTPFSGNPFIQKGFSSNTSPVTPIRSEVPPTYQIGDTVKHIKFGVGIVTALNKVNNDYQVSVDFSEKGVKKMMASFARLNKLN